MFKVAVVGTGFIGRQHIEAIMRCPGVEIVALVGIDEEIVTSLQKEFCIPNKYESVEELLLHEKDLDAVHNCTPNGLHYSINKQLIDANINIFCEKPLTQSSEESGTLLELLAEKNLVCGVNFNYRQNIIVEEMRERVKNSQNKPWFVFAEYLQDWLLFETDFDWRIEREIGGVSRAVADIGSHCFDTLQYILDSKIISVEAKVFKKYDIRFNDGESRSVDNEDAGLIFLEFENGVKGFVRVSQVTAGKKNDLKISIEMDDETLEWYQEKPDRLHVGKRDTGNEEIYASSQYLGETAGIKAVLPNGHAVGWADAFTEGVKNFYKTIDTNEKYNIVDFDEGHYLMKVIEAVVQSSKQNKKITI